MEKIKLKCGKVSALVQTKGAQMASFTDPDGRERIWQGDPDVWAQHAPVLFPVCGSVKDNQIKIAGKTYPMTKHGFTRNPDFTITRVGDDFVELTLTPTDESKPMYPFNFAFHVTYVVRSDGYSTTFTVENNSDCVMPFCLGGHPGFALPMEDGACFEDYQLVFPFIEDGKNLLAPGGVLIDGWEYLDCFHNTDTLPLSHGLFDSRDALIFTELKSRSVKLVNRRTGKGIQFDFPKFEVLAVWTMPNKNGGYLCLEPWHGMPEETCESGNFEDKPFVTMLDPGHSYQCTFNVTLI